MDITPEQDSVSLYASYEPKVNHQFYNYTVSAVPSQGWSDLKLGMFFDILLQWCTFIFRQNTNVLTIPDLDWWREFFSQVERSCRKAKMYSLIMVTQKIVSLMISHGIGPWRKKQTMIFSRLRKRNEGPRKRKTWRALRRDYKWENHDFTPNFCACHKHFRHCAESAHETNPKCK